MPSENMPGALTLTRKLLSNRYDDGNWSKQTNKQINRQAARSNEIKKTPSNKAYKHKAPHTSSALLPVVFCPLFLHSVLSSSLVMMERSSSGGLNLVVLLLLWTLIGRLLKLLTDIEFCDVLERIFFPAIEPKIYAPWQLQRFQQSFNRNFNFQL